MASRRLGSPPPVPKGRQSQIGYVARQPQGVMNRPVSGWASGCLLLSIFSGFFISFVGYVSPTVSPTRPIGDNSAPSSEPTRKQEFSPSSPPAAPAPIIYSVGDEVEIRTPGRGEWLAVRASYAKMEEMRSDPKSHETEITACVMTGAVRFVENGERFRVVNIAGNYADIIRMSGEHKDALWRVPATSVFRTAVATSAEREFFKAAQDLAVAAESARKAKESKQKDDEIAELETERKQREERQRQRAAEEAERAEKQKAADEAEAKSKADVEADKKSGIFAVNDRLKLSKDSTLPQSISDRKRIRKGEEALDRVAKVRKGAAVRVMSIDQPSKLYRIMIMDGPEKGFVGWTEASELGE